jgi:hypothetical protein
MTMFKVTHKTVLITNTSDIVTYGRMKIKPALYGNAGKTTILIFTILIYLASLSFYLLSFNAFFLFSLHTVPAPPLHSTDVRSSNMSACPKLPVLVPYSVHNVHSTLVFSAANPDLTFQSTCLVTLFWDARISPHTAVANPTFSSHTPLPTLKYWYDNLFLSPLLVITKPYTDSRLQPSNTSWTLRHPL